MGKVIELNHDAKRLVDLHKNSPYFDNFKTTINNDLDESFNYTNNGIVCEELMVKYAPSDGYKKYAELLLNSNLESKKIL